MRESSAGQAPRTSSLDATVRSSGDYFDLLHRRLVAAGRSPDHACQAVFEAYLDGKPPAKGRHKPTRAERDRWFWSSGFVSECGPGDWNSETGTLVLTRYLSQTKVFEDGLVSDLARKAPGALALAMRRARLVLTPDSLHLRELRAARAGSPILDETLRVHDVLVGAHQERNVELAYWKATLDDATAFELLLLASLYAHDQLVPHTMTGASSVEASGNQLDVYWEAINDLLSWKLRTKPSETLNLNDELLGRALRVSV